LLAWRFFDTIMVWCMVGAWSAPPIHKLQIMTECYWAEFEAHEKVATYLHLHLAGALTDVKGKAVHERIRKECEDVRNSAFELSLCRSLLASLRDYPTSLTACLSDQHVNVCDARFARAVCWSWHVDHISNIR
jgi:hypothetical protein